jgi:hypothetical protein
MKKMTRYNIIKKYGGTNKKPTPKELEEAYGYLDYCYWCGKKITFWDRILGRYQHGIMGNSHKRSCGEPFDYEAYRNKFPLPLKRDNLLQQNKKEITK